MTSNDTRSARQLSAFSWAMTMDKVMAKTTQEEETEQGETEEEEE